MLDLVDLRLVAALDAHGSLAGAAREMGVTPPALSMRLKRLESTLGVHLVARGARGSVFTEEGQRLRDEARDVLARMAAIPESVAHASRALAGPLRMAAPLGFGRRHVAPLVQSFRARHPEVNLTLTLSDRPLAETTGLDLVVHIGAIKDSSWVAHRLASNQRWVCASPAYLARRGVPAHPDDLARHDCLVLRENDEDVSLWRFRPAETRVAGSRGAAQVRIRPVLAANDGEVICQWASQGMGVMVRSEWEAAPLLRQGVLRRVLPDWDMDPAPIVVLAPRRQGQSARARAFLAHLKAGLATAPWRVTPS